MTRSTAELAQAWQEWKLIEQDAVAKRRAIEDQLTAMAKLEPGFEGAHQVNDFMKANYRNSHKVDVEKLEALAHEHGLSGHLSELFRFKVEINASKWKGAAPELTEPLLGAIETKPSRPSYSIDFKKLDK